jgi:hypothetical protein
MFTDYVLNGEGHGDVGVALQGASYDTGYYKPFVNDRGQKCVTINTGRQKYNAKTGLYTMERETVLLSDLISKRAFHLPIYNSLTMRKDEWIKLDTVVIEAARQRLRAWSDLAAANTYTLDGMGTMILEYEAASDPQEAVVDMNALSEGRDDPQRFQLRGIPLPITHSDFFFDQRMLSVSRNRGTPLDSLRARAAGRRVAEKIEQTTIGTVAGMQYGTSTDYDMTSKVYGYTNYPDRVTKTDMVAPTGSNGSSVLTSWLELRELMYDANFYGPFMVYTSSDYDAYLDNLFSTTEPSAGTLRSRLLEIDGIRDIRRLDYLTNTFTVIFVQMTEDVARAIIGMGLQTLMWEEKGGLMKKFKVMCIQLPQIRSDFDGNCGVGHGTTA